ncbi:glycosyltransferase family 31 protein [Pochonia chlamydosporia 170]|uniref:Glycosyltransferase family 31 protein n=1 Tax=Pochonia chlamydosporia 170 TaxID=1380566 RepID=A0A179F1U6_METCM|nr:glycosyltransferase family 31 protein [Pochonia chlamydosporia 170]OAQ59059.1 glycosyltransferase family 31 protein [Pochonia chlamydosporia 170]
MRILRCIPVLTKACLVIFLVTFIYLRLWSIPKRVSTVAIANSKHDHGSEPHGFDTLMQDEVNCQADHKHLLNIKKKYELNTFTYAKRLVRFNRKNVQRKGMTILPQRLFTAGFQFIDANSQVESSIPGCSPPIQAPVSSSAFPQGADASEFMFGVSTTYERFTEWSTAFLDDWTYWLTDGAGKSNGGKMVLAILNADEGQLTDARSLLTKTGVDVDVIAANASLPMATRYLSLIPTMHTHPDAGKKKWLVLCDDDTFFPSMNALKERLEEYDHKRELYIGALSEDAVAVQRHGSQAFGGAGVFLSPSIASRVASAFQNCTSEAELVKADWQGDRLLHQCIQEHSDISLTILPGLWQLDVSGDPAGFYEWGTKPLSLHHYRSWYYATPNLYSKIAYVCGEDCTLQRFQTADDYIITGYSIAHYPVGISFNTEAIEATFRVSDESGWNFACKFGALRKSLTGTGRKISWELKESIIQKDGCLLQTYIRKGNDTRWVNTDIGAAASHDSVIELVWGPGGTRPIN